MPPRKTTQLIHVLKTLMVVDRADREPYYRKAASLIVDLRRDHGGDWAGKTGPYKIDIQQAYRAAGVPTDAEDPSIQAALRYHVNVALREQVEPEELDTAGLDRASSRQKMHGRSSVGTKTSPDGRRTPRKTSEAADGPSIPTILSQVAESPVALVRGAIRSLEAAIELQPAGEDAETVRYMLRALRDAADNLAALVD